MTNLSHTILESYQVRKSKKQKKAFADLLTQYFPELQVQTGNLAGSRNLILGNVEKAKVVLSAHYDTCSRLPFPNFITPKNVFFYILYNIAVLIPLLAVFFLARWGLAQLRLEYWTEYWLSLGAYFLLLLPLIAGPANKNTANDNTSGVITLCELYAQLSPEERKKVAIVLFDHEESGLFGSAMFRRQYKKQMKDKLLINFDCVSDGDYLLLAVSKAARGKHMAALEKSFVSKEEKNVMLENSEKVFYPSDQAGFKCTVAVAALKHNRFLGYYMDKIHTNKDTNFDKRNIELLCSCTRLFISQL